MNAEITSPVPAHDSPGAAIRDARTRAGLSIDELGSRTRLSRATLEAMESDAFDQLLEPVYVRGYYRKCARILKLPEQPLIDAYEALYTPPPKIAPTRLRLASGGDLGKTQRLSGRFAVIAPIVAVVVCAAIWILRPSSTTPGATPTVSLLPAPVADGGAITDTLPPITPAAPSADAADPGLAPGTEGDIAEAAEEEAAVLAAASETPPAVEDTKPAEPAPKPAEPAPKPVAPVPAGTQLVLEFSAISWARVEDASGKSLASGVISAGERLALDGKPPYSVFLGNAPGVKVRFGGQPVNLAPYTQSNSTAKFSVPSAPANGG